MRKTDGKKEIDTKGEKHRKERLTTYKTVTSRQNIN
jgi:hypothetical protein